MSRRAECAAPTCNSWTGISGNMPTSRRRSPWATRSPALHTRSVGSCPKWRDFRRETTWLSRPDGAMASAAIAWSAIRTFVPTCVGPDSDRWEVLQSSSPSRTRYLVKANRRLKFEELAPLTDAGMTPFRGMKKLRDAGALGPGRVIGVLGIGGLGGYAVQYAQLLGGGAKVVAFARNPDKLAIAKNYGADHIINIKDKSSNDIAKELSNATGQADLDAIIDCAGAEQMMQLGFSLLA